MEHGGVEKELCEQYFHPQMELRRSTIEGRQIKGREKVSGERRPLLSANGREGAKGGIASCELSAPPVTISYFIKRLSYLKRRVVFSVFAGCPLPPTWTHGISLPLCSSSGPAECHTAGVRALKIDETEKPSECL